MTKVLLGKKVGMTQIFTEDGVKIPVTVISTDNNVVAKEVKNTDKNLVEVGFGKQKNSTKADLGQYKDLGYVPVFTERYSSTQEVAVGTVLLPSIFNIGEVVDVTGTTKGKGFQGVVKRWSFAGGPKTHGGESGKHRSPGSIAPGQTMGRVFKGQKMGGNMGANQKTVKNLKVVKTLDSDGLILLGGSIPGPTGSFIVIKGK